MRELSAEVTPSLRVRPGNARDVDPHGRYVLYWMTAARRPRASFALERAAAWARQLGRPLLVLEGLRAGYPWGSLRHHRYVLDGMADNAAAFAATEARYYPYVEPEVGAGRGLLAALGGAAAVVVGDDSPAFFLPRMLAAAGGRLPVRLELVDGNGLLPLAAAPAAAPTAYLFRRLLQRELPLHLRDLPALDPLAEPLPPWPRGGPASGALPAAAARFAHQGSDLAWLSLLPPEVVEHWPAADPTLLAGAPDALAALPVDRTVAPVAERGGYRAGARALDRFLETRLDRYETERNQPEAEATSELSAYLHYGHLGAHEVFLRLAAREGWTPLRLASTTSGSKAGWWGMSSSAEAFLDELVTWREVAFNTALRLPEHDRFASLPPWARRTLGEHAADPRQHLYTLEQLAAADTHDPLWNAAQRQLLREGRIHNYLRMLWGKKVLEWSPSPEAALDWLVELNNRYAIDGRDPNSIAGISWCLGRYDRPWAPVRPIFGSIRYMSSANTARKVSVKGYLARYGPLSA